MSNDEFFRDFEFSGDAGIEVDAPSRADLLACAAIGMARIMVAPDDIDPREHRTLQVSGGSDEDQIHEALAGALSMFQADGFIWRDATAEERPDGIALRLCGEPFDQHRHHLITKLRSVAHPQLDAPGVDAAENEGWKARVAFAV